jgi:mannan endo-1,4-beta-mannosidase
MPFVRAQGTEFQLNDDPFVVTGFNCYFLAYCSDESRRAVLLRAKALEASVIRAWAFLAVDDFAPGRVAFQYFQDGRIMVNDGPDGLNRLDALIKAADDLDIKLILPLVNYWKDLGGMPAYVQWLAPGCDVSEFYRSPLLRAAYRDLVTQVLTRRNSLTGRLYSDEPAILAWELTNEARCPVPGGRELLLDWTCEMAEFVKSLDPNHLLALGDEGFFCQQASSHLYNGKYGVDWFANLAVPEIDFGTYHFYPDQWETHPAFGNIWMQDHIDAAAALNKPALMEEFGLRDATQRPRWYPQWTGLLWMLGHQASDTSGYVDDYVIY